MFVQQRLILIGCKVVARSLHHTHRKLYTQSLWISRFVYLKACISISSSVFANPKQLTKCWLLFVMYLSLKMFWLHTGLYVDDFDWYSNRSAASACQFWKKSLVEMTPMFPTRLQKTTFILRLLFSRWMCIAVLKFAGLIFVTCLEDLNRICDKPSIW